MNIFLKKNMAEIEQCHHTYLAQQHHARLAQTKAKQGCQLLMGKPQVILGIIAAGAYKGASSDAPKRKRNRAISTLARSALLSFIQ